MISTGAMYLAQISEYRTSWNRRQKPPQECGPSGSRNDNLPLLNQLRPGFSTYFLLKAAFARSTSDRTS